jgi:hypothetical protein
MGNRARWARPVPPDRARRPPRALFTGFPQSPPPTWSDPPLTSPPRPIRAYAAVTRVWSEAAHEANQPGLVPLTAR